MSTDLETDLRREFDAVAAPGGLTFSPESVLREGNRAIRRNRILAVGSAAMAVALVAVGATLANRPHDSAAPQPATRAATTGFVRVAGGNSSGVYSVEFNRDTRVSSNVRYFFTPPDGTEQQVGSSSTGKPGQKLDAVWKSGVVAGHPFTLGLVPSPARNVNINFADGGSYGWGYEELKGTGYTMFYVDYSVSPKKPSRPSEIASIRWSGSTGIVDGIEGDHRLTGRELFLSKTVSVEVVLQPADGGRTTVFGNTFVRDADGSAYGVKLAFATTDASGVAVVTGREPFVRPNAKGVNVLSSGPPIAAGILPPGATDIAVVLTTGAAASPSLVSEHLPDGRVIFAIKAEGPHPSLPSKDSIKAVTWTNADGTQGRVDVTQEQG
ncbi:MAG: hypothetical protein HHJ11_03830 [Phycicoccus sp.]|nr:hypothetical protein [Phycicoccus sp.]NMM33444.1 hypothetical protein [Phycicoccus sp.]